MLLTALVTPLPPYLLLSPSLSSTASFSPVEAPDGTAARPKLPSARTTSASTVGFPRESRISRPTTFTISVMRTLLREAKKQKLLPTGRSYRSRIPGRFRVRPHHHEVKLHYFGCRRPPNRRRRPRFLLGHGRYRVESGSKLRCSAHVAKRRPAYGLPGGLRKVGGIAAP